jgi:NADH-quinone oxidoreductase subunit G
VLDSLAEELDVRLGLNSVAAARDELLRLSANTARVAGPAVLNPPAVATPAAGQAVLASWHELLDAGRMSDGDENLAGTAKPARAAVSAATAAELGIEAGELVKVSTGQGAITVPLVIAAIPDGVVWLPTNARGSAVRLSLGVTAGAIVNLSSGGRA